jgi:hypothetical protein
MTKEKTTKPWKLEEENHYSKSSGNPRGSSH